MPPETFKEWVAENPRGLEYLVNHIDMPYFFDDNGVRGMKLIDPETMMYGPEEEVFPMELFVYLAQVLLVCWKHALREAFPDRSFEFYYDVDKDLAQPTIAFWQAER